MIVVSDTTPINYLILIDQVDLLKQLYDGVILPRAAYEEMQRAATPEKVRYWISNRPEWVVVRSVELPNETINLGLGEREAISLAGQIGADLLLADDRKARQAALKLGLAVTGTLGVLAAAARRGMVDLPAAIKQLRETTFRAPEHLIETLLNTES